MAAGPIDRSTPRPPTSSAARARRGAGQARTADRSDDADDDEADLALEVEVDATRRTARATQAADRHRRARGRRRSNCDRYLRAAADLENLRKRTRKRRSRTPGSRRRAAVLKEMLPVVDNLERALEHADGGSRPTPARIIEGVRLVLRQFAPGARALRRHAGRGARASRSIPTLHEAISQARRPSRRRARWSQVLQRGYRIGDRLLRPALVVVAKAPAGGAAGARGDGAARADGGDGADPQRGRTATAPDAADVEGGRPTHGRASIGIDLGTTNSCVAVMDGEQRGGDRQRRGLAHDAVGGRLRRRRRAAGRPDRQAPGGHQRRRTRSTRSSG